MKEPCLNIVKLGVCIISTYMHTYIQMDGWIGG